MTKREDPAKSFVMASIGMMVSLLVVSALAMAIFPPRHATEIRIDGVYTAQLRDPFAEQLFVRVLDIRHGADGALYIKYCFVYPDGSRKHGADVTSSSPATIFRMCFPTEINTQVNQ